tara:strand:- start:926 stop:1093 length:168 start_codon:yes stop_codon:yes gene_type:complete
LTFLPSIFLILAIIFLTAGLISFSKISETGFAINADVVAVTAITAVEVMAGTGGT